MTRHRGFTLLEVMVALAIVSIGLIAVFNGIIQMAHSTAVLRERALADWIAMNQISEIRISGDFPAVGRSNGSTEFANRNWRWEATISETGVADLRRIDLAVAYEAAPDDVVTLMTGFVSRGFGGRAMRVDWWGAGLPPASGPDEDEPPPEDDSQVPPEDDAPGADEEEE